MDALFEGDGLRLVETRKDTQRIPIRQGRIWDFFGLHRYTPLDAL